jgi:hypothetical protein
MFDVYVKDVKVKTKTGEVSLKIRPLSGKYLPKLYAAIGKLSFSDDAELSDAERSKQFLQSLDEAAVQNLHEVVLETLKKSYPGEPVESLDEFASQYFIQLFPLVIEVNLGSA